MTDPDAPPLLTRRAVVRLLLGAVPLVALVAVAAGWVWAKGADARTAGRLYAVAFASGTGPGRRLTDAEFEQALGLIDSPDPTAREQALSAAARFPEAPKDELFAAHQAGRPAPPGRHARLTPVVVRLLDSTDAADRRAGLMVVHLAGLDDFRPRVEALRADPDPLVRPSAAGVANGLNFREAARLVAIGRPLTAAEFARAVELCASPDLATRGQAAEAVATAVGRLRAIP
jgi:hypothetical protein